LIERPIFFILVGLPQKGTKSFKKVKRELKAAGAAAVEAVNVGA
jgi:hypothetical protein